MDKQYKTKLKRRTAITSRLTGPALPQIMT